MQFFFTIQVLIWSYYSLYYVEQVAWLPFLLCSCALLSTREQYLSDVLIGFYLTVILWFLYHVIATEPTLRRQSRLISWIEKDIILWEEGNPELAYKERIDQQPRLRCW